MKFTVDTERQLLEIEGESIPLYSEEAFKVISKTWLKLGWNGHYHYTFTWMGQPILQLPEDILRLQEVLFSLKPDVIVETGIALGGSLLFYAAMNLLNAKGRVIGIDIDLRPHNRKAIQANQLSSFITLVDGNSTEKAVFSSVRSKIKPKESVFVVLDSNHTKEHVLQELELYSQLVTSGSYILVADGFKQFLTDVPRGKKEWSEDHPAAAVEEFLGNHSEFVLEYPERRYNRSTIREPITHFTHGWLRRI